MLALPGSAYLYQGEELGLHEVPDIPEDLIQDPVFSRSRGAEKGRDGCRVPLPWTAGGTSFGFGPGPAQVIFHDVAGWLMIALALVLLLVEWKVLSHLFIPAEADASPPLLGQVRANRPQQTQRPAEVNTPVAASL